MKKSLPCGTVPVGPRPRVKQGLSCSAVLHLLSRSCILDAERLVIVRAVGLDTRCAKAIEDAIIRKASRLVAVLTLLNKSKGV